MNHDKHSRAGSRQTAHLPVILWILPLLAINIGFSFFARIDAYWQKHEHEIEARQEVEALAAGSDFSYQYARRAGEFAEEFKAGVEAGFNDAQLSEHLKSREQRIFRWPFPDYELFTFKVPAKGASGKLLHFKTGAPPIQRVLIRTFSHLVQVNKHGDAEDASGKQNERMLSGLFGSDTRSDVTAHSQKGKATFVMYRGLPSWFLWDYFETADGTVLGYYLLSRFSERHETAGRLLALRDLRERKQALGAFIPVLLGQGGIIGNARLEHSGIFRNWALEYAGIAERNLEKWLASGTPEVARLGNYLAFSYIGKSQSHLAVYLTPVIEQPGRPLWLFLFNLGSMGLLILMILRGLLLKQWPEFNLRFRFIMTYLLSATLPLSLLIISSYGYIAQYRRAAHFETINRIQLSIKQFDTRKSQIEEDYRFAFNNIFKDEKLQKILTEQGCRSKEAIAQIRSHFFSAGQKLPLLYLAIIDENGEGERYYEGQKKAEADPSIDAFSYPIAQLIRNKITAHDPQVKFEELQASGIQKTAAEAYKSMAGRTMVSEVDSRRSFPIKRQIGASTATQMHELFWINGREKYAIFVSWDDQALDKVIFKNSLNQIALNNPSFNFVGFKADPQGFSFLDKPDRHIDGDFVDNARELALMAKFRGSYASKQYDNLSLVAMPAKKYDQVIIVGGTQHFSLNRAIDYRIFVLLAILLLSLAVVLIASYYSAKLLLDPIETLKTAIERVASGHLTTEIESHSEDELGILCREFSTMAVGLRERKRLATLLSDQAMDAITKTGDGSRLFDNETFSGVALVSDIRNFTGICEDYPPDKVTELLNEHFASMAAIISSYGGRIYKFVGDAIEAVFPEVRDSSEDAATRAFNAAAMMLIKARQINQVRLRRKLFGYKIGIGLAYGTMHSGTIGSIETRLDYAIIGEPLKLAAKLEALSSQIQVFPMVLDAHINKALQGHGLVFKEFSEVDGQQAYCLYEIGEGSNPLTIIEQKQGLASSNRKAADEVEKFVVGTGKTLSAKGFFALGAALVAAIVGGIIFATNIREHEVKLRQQNLAANSNQRMLEQVRSENADRIGLENRLRKLTAELEERANSDNKFFDQNLAAFLEPYIETGSNTAAIASRIAVYLVKPDLDNATPTCQSREAFMHGWTKKQSAMLGRQAALNRLVVSIPNSDNVMMEHENPDFESLFGDQITGRILHYETLGKVTEIITDGQKEYFFWDYIVTGADPKRKGAFAKSDKAEIRGYIMFSLPVGSIKESPSQLIESYETDEQRLALISPAGAVISSDKFPKDLKLKLTYEDRLPDHGDDKISSDYIKIGQERYRAVVCAKIESKTILEEISFYLALLILSAITLSIWWKASLGDSFINTSLTAKLWLTLLLASIVPLTTLFFVFGLYTDEDYSVSISQEKYELHRFMDLFELRESYTDPLAWKMIRNWSRDDKTQEAAAIFNKEYARSGQISSESRKLLDDIFTSWFREHEKLDSRLINFVPRDIVMAGSGWTHVSSGADGKGPSNFATMLQGTAKNMAGKRFKTSKINVRLDSEAVQGEIIVETGLQTVKSLFGDDVFVRMAHSVETPVLMSAISGTIGIITHMVPDIDNPEYMILWMVAFEYENYLNRLAYRYHGKYDIFAALAHRHSAIVDPRMADYRHDLAMIGAWITSANLPLSSQIERSGERFLVEGRPGVAQSSFLVAASSEAPIQAKIAGNRVMFWLSFLLSVVLILVIAKNAAADILTPVESLIRGMKFASCENYSFRINMKRADELGNLCAAFDSMMRGLEEKNLMGKMLSKGALNFSEQNGSDSSTGEFVFLYIGIPSFASWVAGSSVEQMFIDLKEQITQISGFVIGEGGDVDKIIGDKMLAVYAVNGSLQDAVDSACRTAIKIITAESRANLPFPVAIGINCGKVITGVLGVGDKRDFTVIGDAVNVAARIESVAEVLRYQRCLLSESVFKAIKPGVVAREYGEVELKGKAMPVKVYQLSI
ncbi:MAG: HAMP domain-containing protein [Candidatus Riflebacteria bacterium]|nr:HAMP domain-containing protein [Candidatus Riflebacteria bacterium]